MGKLRGVCVGAGYFSDFQYAAWARIPEVEITAFCNRDKDRTAKISDRFGIKGHYIDYKEMLDREKPDFIDIITPPPSHLELCTEAASRGIHIICQKPLAPSIEEARAIVAMCEKAGVRFMVHENFRFQPWHRQIKAMIEKGLIGEKLYSISVSCRMGDGWGENAYIPRQPYFRDYPRLFIYETGVHFIDTFRYLAGEITRVTAWLRKLNPVIKGEDCALAVMEFANGTVGIIDANRYNEPDCPLPDARYTFGKFLFEGSEGTIRLHIDGRITLQRLGEPEINVDYVHTRRDFAGDCCYATQRHFIDRMQDGGEFETNGRDYLKTLGVQEAVYTAALNRVPVTIT